MIIKRKKILAFILCFLFGSKQSHGFGHSMFNGLQGALTIAAGAFVVAGVGLGYGLSRLVNKKDNNQGTNQKSVESFFRRNTIVLCLGGTIAVTIAGFSMIYFLKK